MIPIGKMAGYCQTSIQTLRLYDRKGLLRPAFVDSQSHYRYYLPEQIFQFALIKYLQSSDLTLEEIKAVLADDSINLATFWKAREERIRHQIQEEQKKLTIARFQRRQLDDLAVMRDHSGRSPYIRQIRKHIGMIPVTIRLGPTDIPDQAVAELDHCLLDHAQIPNLEYGFSLDADRVTAVSQIQYRTIFKELVLSPQRASHAPTDRVSAHRLRMAELSGTYACVSFMWSTAEYMPCLKSSLMLILGIRVPSLRNRSR